MANLPSISAKQSSQLKVLNSLHYKIWNQSIKCDGVSISIHMGSFSDQIYRTVRVLYSMIWG